MDISKLKYTLLSNPDFLNQLNAAYNTQQGKVTGFPIAAHLANTGTVAPYSAQGMDAEIADWYKNTNFGGTKQLPNFKKTNGGK